MRRPAAGLLLLLVLFACNRIETEPRPPRPNLLLVTIDTLRADHVGAYGAEGDPTPALDWLAAGGVRFETALAAAPLTLPSHASIFTGLYPPRHGARHNGLFELPADAETLAERVGAAGYATGAVIGSFVLERRFGLAQGFDHYDDSGFGERRSGPAGYFERGADEVSDRALGWLMRAPEPFFLWVHYFDPHSRYAPPARWAERFPGRPYQGEIAYADAQLARLFAWLVESGRAGRTLVVATSDHGESLDEHGEQTHGYTLYDATLRVPLLVRGPGVPVGRVVRGPVRTVDIAPTLLARLGLPGPEPTDGEDLAPLWRGEERAGARVAYAEALAPRFDHGWSPLFAARSERFLYVRAPRPELYDLEADPRQLENLLEDGAPEARAAAAELERRLAPLAAVAPGPAAELDAGTRAALRALGYAVADAPVAPSGLDPKDGLAALPDYVAATEAFDALDLTRAEAHVARALERMPDSPSANALAARIHLVRQQPGRAVPHLLRAVRSVPRSALYASLLGDAKAALGDAAGAVAAYRRALEIDPEMAPAHVGAMWQAAVGGSLEEARRHAERAAALMPESVDLRLRVASVWLELGQPELALAAADDALRLEPASARAHMEAAIALARLARPQEASAHTTAAGDAARDPALQNRLAVAYAQAGLGHRAQALLGDLAERFPDDPRIRRNLARVR